MIVRVVVVPPDVGVLVEANVSVDEPSHVDVSVDVLEFGVVVEGDRSEGVEVIGVDSLSRAHGIPFLLLGGLITSSFVRQDNVVDEGSSGGVEHEVHTVAHSTEGGQSVSSRHISFINLIIMFINQ